MYYSGYKDNYYGNMSKVVINLCLDNHLICGVCIVVDVGGKTYLAIVIEAGLKLPECRGSFSFQNS